MPTRDEALNYAMQLLQGDIEVEALKTAHHFGRCEIQALLDYIYGRRADGRSVEEYKALNTVRGDRSVKTLDLPAAWVPWIAPVAPTIEDLANIGGDRMLEMGVSHDNVRKIRAALRKAGWVLK